MMYIEKQKRGSKVYFYLVKSVRNGKKVGKEKKFLGTNLSKEELIIKSENAKRELEPIFDTITKEEEKDIIKTISKLNKIISTIPKENFYEHFITEFTYDSNSIEGSTLTLDETRNVIFEGLSPKKPLKDVKEALNHKEAFDVMETYSEKININFICRLQGLVVKDVLPDYLKIFEGKLRGVNVRVGNHIAPNFDKVQTLLKKLLLWYHKNRDNINPLVMAAYFHCVFEDIHPFVDGNGRTGRLLLNIMLMRNKYPYINIPVRKRFSYYKALDQFHKTSSCRQMVLLLKNIYMSTLNKYEKEL